MNPVLDAIENRRSVRRFEDRVIPKEILEALIQAGNQAPSASNQQPWRFVVIAKPENRRRLAEIAKPLYVKWLATTSPEFQERRRKVDAETADPVYYAAPAIVFVIGKKEGPAAFDCPMVCQNLMLAAYSMGLGSCWVYIGSLAAETYEVQAMLGLQADERVYGPIVLGYPSGGFPAAPAKKPPQISWL